MRYVVSGLMLFLMVGAARAQSHPDWFMQNYHFTGPPPPGEVKAVDPALTQIKEIQSTVQSIMRRAKFEGDYETALWAASQAVANAQLIGAITERQQAAQVTQAPQPAKPAMEAAQMPAPFVLIALKDKTINAATSYWADGPMLNYVTVQGMHIIVRMDLVDRALSRDLNRQQNVEFRLPE
jgi:uncharacterized membrane protein YgcG